MAKLDSSTAESRREMRDRLEREFVALHMRRFRIRRAVQVSAAMLVGLAAFGWIWNANLARRQTGLPGPPTHSVTANHVAPRTVDGSRASSDAAPRNANIGPSYQAIQVTDLSDDELRSLLVATHARWFVAEIDGRPTAFPLN